MQVRKVVLLLNFFLAPFTFATEYTVSNGNVVTSVNTPVSSKVGGSSSSPYSLNFQVVTQGTKGVVQMHPPTGIFTYTPNKDAVGLDSFTFRLGVADDNDPSLSPIATVNVRIKAYPTELSTPSIDATHTCAVNMLGAIKCWGANDVGQLGLGDTLSRGNKVKQMGTWLPEVNIGTGLRAKKVFVAYGRSCAILDNGLVKCWGYRAGADGKHLGTKPSDMGDALPYLDLGANKTAQSIAMSTGDTCVVLNTGELKCWGPSFDNTGRRGDALPPLNLGTNRTVSSVARGEGVWCAILDNGGLKCFGMGNTGILGTGNSNNTNLPVSAPIEEMNNALGDNLPYVNLGTGRTVKSVSLGEDHACALLDNAQIKCWGVNELGQLGIPNVQERGLNPNEMGDSLPYVNLGAGRTAKDVVAGFSRSCAILDNAQIKCWGDVESGPRWIGAFAGSMGDNLPYTNLGTGRTVKKLTLEEYHNCAILDNRDVKCWRVNDQGTLGLGNDTYYTSPSELGDNLPAVSLWP